MHLQWPGLMLTLVACAALWTLELNAMEIDPSQMTRSVDTLFKAFSETDAGKRNELLSNCVLDDVAFWYRNGRLDSAQELSEYITSWLETRKNHPLERDGEVQGFYNVARTAWKTRLKGYYQPQAGEAYFEWAEDGRLSTVVMFSDPPHHVLFGGGPDAYVNAWNSRDAEEKPSILRQAWTEDSRWVEMRFDHRGPDAIAAQMKPPITLTPVDGVMDLIHVDGHGSQVRFEVDVRHDDGREFGRFTDFAFIDDSGKTRRLAGFKGASLSMKHKTSVVDPDWNWSYVSGYRDPQGKFAGGSEVMHLAAYRGKLYAANGYWEDNHWVVPAGAAKQSAQVLRLDSPEGPWEVELDLGEASPDGIDIMKGNILKAITFTMGGDGQELAQPVELLFMAASNIRSHTLVWTLNDETGQWDGQVVGSGESIPNIRWVPRDVEVFTDKKTGQERVFMLMGNIGVLSGVYDPSAPTRIRWDEKVEFPQSGFLDVRALGMTAANGDLFFSAGRYLYQRHDGENPGYSTILDLHDPDDDVINVEMGGIRGLSTIPNPTGEGESLIFMWSPHGRSHGQIVRLDPDGEGGFVRHDEVVVGDLVPGFIGRDVSVRKVLGAYNNFQPFKDPASGEAVHVFGFQVQLNGADELVGQSRYYKGGSYVIRRADQTYELGEINGLFEPGKARIIGPRSFILSPFGDDHIYAAGYDSNFVESTGLAWIFNAHRDVWMAPLRNN